jgi:hypothetical protein
MNNRFAYNIHILVSDQYLKDLTIGEYIYNELKIYDFYEKYNELGVYQTDEYSHEYIKGYPRKYVNHLIEYEYDGIKYSYVVPKEVMNKDELNLLKKYCRCDKHRTSYFNFKRYITCGCCVGCLDSINPAQKVIYDTRNYIKKIDIII